MIGALSLAATEHKLQAQKLARLGRIHAVLHGVEAAIVRTEDGARVLQEACRLAVADGEFGLAWIGLYDCGTQRIQAIASAGLREEQAVPRALLLNGAPSYGGVLARALATGSPSACNNIAKAFVPASRFRQEALRRGLRSMIMLPLCIGSRVAGVFTLFARESHAFSEDEIVLLVQLAHDVSLALAGVDCETALGRAALESESIEAMAT